VDNYIKLFACILDKFMLRNAIGAMHWRVQCYNLCFWSGEKYV